MLWKHPDRCVSVHRAKREGSIVHAFRRLHAALWWSAKIAVQYAKRLLFNRFTVTRCVHSGTVEPRDEQSPDGGRPPSVPSVEVKVQR